MILPRRRQRDRFLPWILLLADAVTIQAVLRTAYWLRFHSALLDTRLGVPDFEIYARAFNFVTLAILFFLRHYGLYQTSRTITFAEEAGKVFKAVTGGMIVLAALTFFVRNVSFSRVFLVLSGLSLAAGVALARYGIGMMIVHIDRVRGSQRNLLILGAEERGRKLTQLYRKNPRYNARVAAYLDDAKPLGGEIDGVPVVGRLRDLGNYLAEHREIHEVVLAVPRAADDLVLQVILECEKHLVAFRWVADLFGMLASKMRVRSVGNLSLLSFTDSPLSDWENRLVKRLFDLIVSAAALVCLSPVMLVIGLAVKLDSPGPVFYRQRRVGEDGRRFSLYKFRTMKAGRGRANRPVWTRSEDPRRTRVGSVLRRFNLDELPQLYNVLVGEMSLVGPRPERLIFVRHFREDIPRYMARHTVRSGITGWAQVNGLRGDTSIEERTQFDLYYIENWSIWFDLKIIFLTLIRFFNSRNAY